LFEKTATWKNDLESETRKLKHDNYFYIAANPTPQGLELLINAIQKTQDKSISLLPSGSATVETLTSYEVALLNEKKTVTLYAIKGLGYTPDYVWLDGNNRLFALAYGSMSMIRKGWSQNIETLQSIQDELFSTYMQTASKKTTEKLPEITAINNVNIFNSIDSHLQRNMQLIIKNGRIVEINSTAKTFDDAKQIDGTNKTLMAGLWDMHVHTALEHGLFNIASGITNARDVGSVYDELL
jgi:hypothetical protein